MGVVYHARQVRLNRPCALKMILAGAHAGDLATSRFLAEAQAVARLHHPNIVQIHHISESDGLPYFELEYVEGGSLRKRLDGTPWPARRAAGLVEVLARGVAEAHRLGIVHRDLKPDNVLMAADGTPKITDFGLAKSLEGDSGLTATDSIMGSPGYMAPEQAEGKAKQVGPLADVYALGAILYELLTGRPPFRAATVLETLEQVKATEPVPPSRLVPGLSRDIETIALKCLQKEPGKRYDSAAALAEDLRRCLTGEPIRARPVGDLERLVRWARRHPTLAGLTAAAVLSLATGTVVSTYFKIQADARAADARTAAVRGEGQRHRGRSPPGRGRGRRRHGTRPAQPPEHRHRHPLPRRGRRGQRAALVRSGLGCGQRPGSRGGPSAPGGRGAGGAAGAGRPRRPQRPGLRRRLQPRRCPHPDPGGGAGGVHLGLRARTPGRAAAPT